MTPGPWLEQLQTYRSHIIRLHCNQVNQPIICSLLIESHTAIIFYKIAATQTWIYQGTENKGQDTVLRYTENNQ